MGIQLPARLRMCHLLRRVPLAAWSRWKLLVKHKLVRHGEQLDAPLAGQLRQAELFEVVVSAYSTGAVLNLQ